MTIKHILDTEPDNDGDALVFTHWVDETNGKLKPLPAESCCQPEDWDNVRHIVGCLFYAWDNNQPEDGGVYLGELQ